MKKIIDKLNGFDLYEFLVNTPELEFLEKTTSSFTKKYFPLFYRWSSEKLEDLCECKNGEMFNFFTGMLLAIYGLLFSKDSDNSIYPDSYFNFSFNYLNQIK